MFQFSRFASMAYVFSQRYTRRCGFPHSEICGSKLVCQLPAAYRRLQRPSSPVFAKASTMCTYSLDPITMKAIGSMSFRACAVQSIVVFENLELKKINAITTRYLFQHATSNPRVSCAISNTLLVVLLPNC